MNRRMNLHIFLLFVCIFVWSAIPAKLQAKNTASEQVTQQTDNKLLTLDQSVNIAVANSPEVKMAEMAMEKAAAQVKEARAGFLPTLSMSYTYRDMNLTNSKGPGDPDYMEQRNKIFSINAVQTLFAGLTIFNTYQRAKLNLESYRMRKKYAELDKAHRVQQAFIRLLAARREADSYKESTKRLEEQLKASKMMLDRELIPYVDYLSVKVKLADARQKLSSAQNDIEVATIKLIQELGLQQNLGIEFSGDLTKFAFDFDRPVVACLSCAMKNRPEVKLVDLSLKMASKDKQIALGSMAPRVEFDASYNSYMRDYKFMAQGFYGPYNPDQKNEYWMTGINVRWNFFDGGKKYYGFKGAVAEYARLEYQKQQIFNQIEAQLKSDHYRLLNSSSRIEVAKGALGQAKENFQMADRRFYAGIGSRLELLQAHDDLVKAQVNLSQARADYLKALSDLYFDMGTPYEFK